MSRRVCLPLFPLSPEPELFTGGNASNRTPPSPGQETLPVVEEPPKRARIEPDEQEQPGHDVARYFTIYLPDDLLHKIFSYLPIKKATQMSVLARTFKKDWVFSRKLEFDENLVMREDFFVMVDRIFNLHEGSFIQSFIIHLNPYGVEPYLLKWIDKAVEKGVEEIELDCFLSTAPPMQLSPEFLNTRTLKILRLSYCAFIIPETFTGLRHLNTLIIKKALSVTESFIETIFEHCKSLQNLQLVMCPGLRQLRVVAESHKNFKVLRVGDCTDLAQIDICAPTLRTFHYFGSVIVCRFLCASQLDDVIYNMMPSKLFTPNDLISRLLHHFSNATKLTTSGTFLEGLCKITIKEGTTWTNQPTLRQLKELNVIMEGATFIDTFDIACFIRNCPQLETLFIDLNTFSFSCGAVYEFHHKELIEKYSEFFTSIKFVKILGFKYQKHEVELAKFFLRTTPVLEKLVLVSPKPSYQRRKVYNNPPNVYGSDCFFCCWKASPNAEIKFYDSRSDTSSIYPTHSCDN